MGNQFITDAMTEGNLLPTAAQLWIPLSETATDSEVNAKTFGPGIGEACHQQFTFSNQLSES
jgi:hypothetical protein